MTRSILVIDDDLLFQMIMRRQLGKLGFKVIENNSGTGVMEQIQMHAPVACIIDMLLDVKEGSATIKEVLALPVRPKILAVSSNPQYLSQAEELTIDGTLLKPVSQAQLGGVLTKLGLIAQQENPGLV